jgi:catalase
MKISYQIPDESLGEQYFLDEEKIAFETADTIEKDLRKQYRTGNVKRDVHAKLTGLVKAEFRVNENIPVLLAQGIFVPGKTYQAYIRYSNGSALPGRSDKKPDGRGMAIKLLNVPGVKALDNAKEASTQDFVMQNHTAFFTSSPSTYLAVMKRINGNIFDKLSLPFVLGLKGLMLAGKFNGGKISNPLQIRYNSISPYQLGVGAGKIAVKFCVKPVSAKTDAMPQNAADDFLRTAMQNTLNNADVLFKFYVQPKTSDNMSVEDYTVEWDEQQAPFYEVATIRIPRQYFQTVELDSLGENLSFNPWHTLPEHRPLGCLNRVRKIVYERISRVRREMNKVPVQEP